MMRILFDESIFACLDTAPRLQIQKVICKLTVVIAWNHIAFNRMMRPIFHSLGFCRGNPHQKTSNRKSRQWKGDR